jgi:hypothetical protein
VFAGLSASRRLERASGWSIDMLMKTLAATVGHEFEPSRGSLARFSDGPNDPEMGGATDNRNRPAAEVWGRRERKRDHVKCDWLLRAVRRATTSPPTGYRAAGVPRRQPRLASGLTSR